MGVGGRRGHRKGRDGQKKRARTHACVAEASSYQNYFLWCFLCGIVKYDMYRKVYKTSLFGLKDNYKADTHLTTTRSRQASLAP